MNQPPRMVQSEVDALMATMSNNFGPCVCMSYERMAGMRVWIEKCAGHEFLEEPHRVDRLLWIRRTASQWQRAEHGKSWGLEQELRALLGSDVDG